MAKSKSAAKKSSVDQPTSAVSEPTRLSITINAPNFKVATLKIVGTAPYVQHRFSKKGELQMKMEQGSQSNKGKKRDPRKFDQDYEDAQYQMDGGGYGIPAAAFRNAMISACRMCGFKMTIAKLAVFIMQDGMDKRDRIPLVRLEGKPHRFDAMVRNATGVIDIRSRPMWDEWSAVVRVGYDGDQFSATDIANLMMRVGMQVGIGEGRPDSKNSAGQGWGLFRIEQDE